jgi:hypothetical protein
MRERAELGPPVLCFLPSAGEGAQARGAAAATFAAEERQQRRHTAHAAPSSPYAAPQQPLPLQHLGALHPQQQHKHQQHLEREREQTPREQQQQQRWAAAPGSGSAREQPQAGGTPEDQIMHGNGARDECTQVGPLTQQRWTQAELRELQGVLQQSLDFGLM